MGGELLKSGVQIRKCTIFLIRSCYRWVFNHPFLVGMAVFVIFLCRSFPFALSLLASASPVLVCTAVLLGTLLYFGQSKMPQIEMEDRTTHEIVSLKTGGQRDAIVVDKHESHAIDTEKRSVVVVESFDEASLTENEVSEVEEEEEEDSIINKAPFSRENSLEIQFEEIVEEAKKELHSSGFKEKSGTNGSKRDHREVLENENSQSQVQRAVDENLEREYGKAHGESIYSQKANHLDTSLVLTWKRLKEGEEEDDEISYFGSDQGGSSSPDASMADIIPVLDELHPLLAEDAPQPASVSHDSSDAASEHSPCSNESDNDDNDNDDDEEETHGDKGVVSNAILWTEEDQKNLMDVGTSELERNQRLESLIASRSARRMVVEKNLIDFGGADHPSNIPPISTKRQNPSDVPADSHELPIPGSAPSVLLTRQNPFDLPYDPNEEKPDIMENSFQQESVVFHPKEPFFRRHESFNVGSSFFWTSRQETQAIRLRPYFVPERIASEGINYFTFQRQSSELSDSEGSSVPETESVDSAEDLEDNKVIIEDSQEPEFLNGIEHATEHVGHGSQSSEDVESVELGQVERRDVQLNEIEIKSVDPENHLEMESNLSGARSMANHVELDANEAHLDTGGVEQKYSSRSSSSSMSRENRKIFDETEDEGLSSLEPRRGNLVEESGMSTPPLLEMLEFDIMRGLMDDTQHKEPVYDLSPPAIRKSLSSSSISFDLQEMGFPTLLVKRAISFTENIRNE